MYTFKRLLLYNFKIISLLLLLLLIPANISPRLLASRPSTQQQASTTSLLTNYDKLISSSPLGEPVFRLQPPNVIDYPNSKGTTLVCLASGSPKPTITWYTSPLGTDTSQLSTLSNNGGGDNVDLSQSSSGRLVTNITNVRQILQDGAALRLLPFQESEFLQDVHTAEYRCVASNPIATIHSKSVSVQAVIQPRERTLPQPQPQPPSGNSGQHEANTAGGQMDFIRVSDEFVQLKAPAVLKCKLTSSSSSWSSGMWAQTTDSAPPTWSFVEHQENQRRHSPPLLHYNYNYNQNLQHPTGPPRDLAIEWFTSDGLQIRPTDWPLAEGERFTAFDTGELHLNNVDMADLRRTYGCRLRNKTTRRLVANSNMAQLILIDSEQATMSGQQQADRPQQQTLIQVLHSVDQMVVSDSVETGGQGQQSAAYDHDTSVASQVGAPHYAISSGSATMTRIRSHNQEEKEQQPAPLLLLPCALRVPAVVTANQAPAKGRWLYQAPMATVTSGDSGVNNGNDLTARAIGLEQFVSLNRKWLQLIDRSFSPASGGGGGGPLSKNQSMPTRGSSGSRLLVGTTFLALERPRRQLSGRYIYQLLFDGQNEQSARTVCDINVIVREPIRLQVVLGGLPDPATSRVPGNREADGRQQTPVMSALTSGDSGVGTTNSWPALTQWFGFIFGVSAGNSGQVAIARHKRMVTGDQQEDLLDRDPSRIKVTGPGSVPQTPIVRVGDRLELACVARGYPIDSVRWFRQGRAINTQSSSDFQTEISTTWLPPSPEQSDDNDHSTGGGSGGSSTLVSRLLIRQLQPRDLGLQMFECFAQNSLGDRARASQAILVMDRQQVSEARAKCPLDETRGRHNHESLSDEMTTSGQLASTATSVRSVFLEQNSFKRALVLEGEPIELHCPLGFGYEQQHSPVQQQQQAIEWLKWTPPPSSLVHAHNSSPGSGKNADRTGEAALKQQRKLARQFNQLFGGESRFVINGSSLQIRSPSKRHDETLFVCVSRQRRRPGPLVDGAIAPSNKLAPDSSVAAVGQHAQQADFGQHAGQQHKQQQQHHHHSVHQSSLATPLPLLESPFDSGPAAGESGAPDHQASCMESLFSLAAAADEQGAGGGSSNQEQRMHRQQVAVASGSSGTAAAAVAAAAAPSPLVSSISIRIVAKPKIDPFEFSRDLEEGMRTVVVCTVVSGQSLVDINWFKDGELLIAGDKDNDGLRIDTANAFSSTLTFHNIRPSHSGHYTCVVSNALASAEHTSRLLVNVAPYFVEPPKSQRAYLNSNVLINCRAGGQPSPQIRWRKLVPVGGASEAKLASSPPIRQPAAGDLMTPPGGSGSQHSGKLTGDSSLFYLSDFASDSIASQKMALANPAGNSQQQQLAAKHEFRIITSNSHIQVLENGSMIIKDVELADAARYSCQASNGVQPVLSEVIYLDVLTPAQFEVNYEKVSVKRDSLVRFNCAPRGDQPMQIDWFKEGRQLVRGATGVGGNGGLSSPTHLNGKMATKYSELIHVIDRQPQMASDLNNNMLNVSQSVGGQVAVAATTATVARHYQLMLMEQQHQQRQSQKQQQKQQQDRAPEVARDNSQVNQVNHSTGARLNFVEAGRPTAPAIGPSHLADNLARPASQAGPMVLRSELIIESADRADTGLFVCVASNLYGKDELSYQLLVQEPPDAPLNLHVQAIQSSSLKLLWQTPFDGNTPISYFIVEYRKLPTTQPAGGAAVNQDANSQQAIWSRAIVSHTNQNQLASGGEEQPPGSLMGGTQLQSQQQVAAENGSGSKSVINSVTLKQLTPKSSYQIRVAAVNPIGQGLFSPIQLVSTAEEAPQTRPADLRAQAISSSAIKLMWRGSLAQPHDQAPVRGYYVSYRRHSPIEQKDATGWLSTVSLSASNYSSTLDDNLPALPVTNLAGQQVSPAPGGGQLVNYELQLSSLERNTKYEVRVQPFNLMGVGPPGELAAQTLKFDRPAQPLVRLVAARKQSLELKWSVPPSQQTGPPPGQQVSAREKNPTSVDGGGGGGGAGELQGFSLYYKCEYDDWREISLAVIYHYVIDNLRCGNKYQIYLSAYNSVGRSDPSDVLSVRTEGSVPLAPDRVAFFRLNITEVVLDMASWSSGGCPISSFMIQFKRLHDSNWYILSEGATPFTQTDKITIPDLVPATWYKLMVNALNEAGSTNAEYIFATLTLDGQQLTPPDYLLDQQQPLRPTGKSTGGGGLWSALSLLLSGGSGGGASGNHLQQDSPLLLPLSCILLLTVTSLATYLYYSRYTSANKASHKAEHEGGKLKQCNHGSNLSPPDAAGGNLQMLDRHLLGASHSCGLNADSASSSGSSSSAQQQQQQHHHHQQMQHNQNHRLLSRAMTLNRSQRTNNHLLRRQQQQLEKQQLIQSHLPGAMSSKSQLVLSQPLDYLTSNNYLSQQQQQQQQVRLLMNQSGDGSQPDAMHQNGQLDGSAPSQVDDNANHQLTNYVLDTFLNQQVTASGDGSGQTSQQTSFVCGQPGPASAYRAATMKLFTGGSSERCPTNSYFDCGASSSLSSSGLGGSAHTTASNNNNQTNNLHLIEECQTRQPSPPPPLNGYELNLSDDPCQLLCGPPHQQGHVDLVSLQQQRDEQPVGQQQQQQHRLLASSSFASAADLVQRQQQQQQQHQPEPIYQRLDRFKACALPACVRQFATMNPQMASKLRQQFDVANQLPPHSSMVGDQAAAAMLNESQSARDQSCFYLPPFGDYNHLTQSECLQSDGSDLASDLRRHNNEQQQQQQSEFQCGNGEQC